MRASRSPVIALCITIDSGIRRRIHIPEITLKLNRGLRANMNDIIHALRVRGLMACRVLVITMFIRPR